MRAFVICECGETRAPCEGATALTQREAVRRWLFKFKFARYEHGTLICRVCHKPIEIRLTDGDVESAAGDV